MIGLGGAAVGKPKIFVSHTSREAALALIFKSHLSQDFLGLVEIFVSSDLESISAGEDWLKSIKTALSESSILMVLCSRGSLSRAWVNFEVGAAWIKELPIIPICHSGLTLSELPVPFSTLQGIEANSVTGLKRLYAGVAKKLGSQIPNKDFSAFTDEIVQFEKSSDPEVEPQFKAEFDKQSASHARVYEALMDPRHKWRTIARLAILGGITEQEVFELLVPDKNIVLSKSKAGNRIARLKSRSV